MWQKAMTVRIAFGLQKWEIWAHCQISEIVIQGLLLMLRSHSGWPQYKMLSYFMIGIYELFCVSILFLCKVSRWGSFMLLTGILPQETQVSFSKMIVNWDFTLSSTYSSECCQDGTGMLSGIYLATLISKFCCILFLLAEDFLQGV